eukprot:gb/GECG01010331.1/.p1 GENE.gb/GECG01010331.1/~~gb/GECG01010331.1/.p1  ORF type:complete len:141 (+),score=10.92 gb/GECG01010331.1/:1-423(+)
MKHLGLTAKGKNTMVESPLQTQQRALKVGKTVTGLSGNQRRTITIDTKPESALGQMYSPFAFQKQSDYYYWLSESASYSSEKKIVNLCCAQFSHRRIEAQQLLRIIRRQLGKGSCDTRSCEPDEAMSSLQCIYLPTISSK